MYTYQIVQIPKIGAQAAINALAAEGWLVKFVEPCASFYSVWFEKFTPKK